MSETPAGWYADPHDPRQQRWWDGAVWTEHTQRSAALGPAGPASGATTWPTAGTTATTTTVSSSQALDPLAIVSLVAALVWLVGLGSVVAIVCGILALRRTQHSTSRTLAIIGLVLGILGLLPALLILLAVMGTVGAVSLPVFLGQADRAVEARLQSDLRGAAIAQESIWTDENSYTQDLSRLRAVSTGDIRDVTIAHADADSFCLEAAADGVVFHYDNTSTNTPGEGPCP